MSQIVLLLPMVFINLIEINIFIPLDLQKKKYFSERFKRCSKDIKTMWEVINQLLQREKTPEPPLDFFMVKILSTIHLIAQTMNSELSNKVSVYPLDFIPRNFIIFKPPDIQEISDTTDELKTSSAGHDNISAFLVKQVKQLVLQPLAHIFSVCENRCCARGI